MVEISVTPNFHGRVDPGYITIQAPTYFCWWDHQEPHLLRLRDPNGEKTDWVEFYLDGKINTVDALEESDSDNFNWNGAETGLHRNSTHALTATLSDGKSVEVEFKSDQILIRLKQKLPSKTRLIECEIGVGKTRASRINSDCVFDSRPASHGIFLHRISDSLDTKNLWFSPPPFSYPFQMEDESWASISLEPTLDELKFSRFFPAVLEDGQTAFRIAYDSQPGIEGEYVSPALTLRFGAKDPFEAIAAYARDHARRADLPCERSKGEDWWNGLTLCGWHNQEHLAQTKGGKPQDYCLQTVYEDHIAQAEAVGIDPDIIIIDDNWAESLGSWRVEKERWPDLKGFISRQHSQRRKVLLWVCAATEGLPLDELYLVGKGPYQEWRTRLLDPHNPNWISRLQQNLSTLLGRGPDDLGADGLKFDFTGNLPEAGEAKCHRELHGLEHCWWLFKRVHEAAKGANPRCLLDFQVANPLFAGLHDMTRLNDYFLPSRQAVRVMETRAKIAKAAAFCPEIDTDCPASPEYYRAASGFGNISLYLTNEDFKNAGLIGAIKEGAKRLRVR